jgi:hypothetical protein
MSIQNGLQIYTKTEDSNLKKNLNFSNNKNIKNKITNYFNKDYKNKCNLSLCNCINCRLIKEKEFEIKNHTNMEKDNKDNYKNNLNTNTKIYKNLNICSNSNESNLNYYCLNTNDMENTYKNYLGMKKNYFNNNIEINNRFDTNESKNTKNILAHKATPFIGRSMNSIMFSSYKFSPKIFFNNKKNILKNSHGHGYINIPFHGKSSYKENFSKFEDKYYIDKISPILKKDNLENFGKIILETTNKESYKNIKFNYNKVKNNFKNFYAFSNLGIYPPQNKDIYLSSYKREFIYNK